MVGQATTSQGVPKQAQRPLNLGELQLKTDTSLAYANRTLLRGITPERCVAIFNGADQYINEQIELAAQMEEAHDHLAGTLEVRRTAVLRLDLQLAAGNPDDPRSVRATELADHFIHAPWFKHGLCDWLLRAIWHQWAAAEVLYEKRDRENKSARDREIKRARDQEKTRRARLDPSISRSLDLSALWMPTGIRAVEPGRWHFDRDGMLGFFRRLGSQDVNDLVRPVAGQFVVHSHGAVAGQPGRYAMVRDTAKLVLLSMLDFTQWGKMADKWGMPFLHFQYDPNSVSNEQMRGYVTAVLDLADELIAATPTGVNVEMHPVPEQGPHATFQDFMRRALSMRILGQVTAQHATAGQETGANLQGQVRDDLRDGDAELLGASLNEGLFEPWCLWNFGPDVAPPVATLAARIRKDPVQRGNVIKLAREIGLPIGIDTVYEDLEIERPAEDAELLPPISGQGLEVSGQDAEKQALQASADDKLFQRDVIRGFIADGTTNDVLFNMIDVRQLVQAAGLPPQPGYEEPWLPIIADAGLPVTGDVERDPQGDIVGGTVGEPVGAPAAPFGAFGGQGAVGSGQGSGFGRNAEDRGTTKDTKSTKENTQGQNGAAAKDIEGTKTDDSEDDDGSALRSSASCPSCSSWLKLRWPQAALAVLARKAPQAVRHVGGQRFLVRVQALKEVVSQGSGVRVQGSGTEDRGTTKDTKDTKEEEVFSSCPSCSSWLKLGLPSSNPFAATVAAVVAAAQDAGSFEGLLSRLQSLFEDGLRTASAPVTDELHTATFGAHAAARLAQHDELQRKVGSQKSEVRSSYFSRRTSHFAALAQGGVPDQVTEDLQAERGRFSAAIDTLAQRSDVVPRAVFDALDTANRQRSFTVARVAQLDVLKDLHGAVGQAVEGGQSYREFVDSLRSVMQQRGWDGLEPWHAQLVYGQNVTMAHSAGRAMQARDAGVGYWRYLPSDSATPRASHARHYGQIFKLGEGPMPPLDYNCKCNWEPVFDDEVPAGVAPTDGPAVNPEQEFQFAPGAYFRPVEVRQGDYPRELWPLIRSLASDANALLNVTE